MAHRRITKHPILPDLPGRTIPFSFNGRQLTAREGEMISSALFAHGITIFGHHARDGGAQGIFCANGQCSQCMVIADGKAVKSCMTPVARGMDVRSAEGLPTLVDRDRVPPMTSPLRRAEEVEVLIIGAGPSGLNAAIELGRLGVAVLLVDDKLELGGKLSLQTHNFFGSVEDCWAGTRGVDIGHLLADEVAKLETVTVWLGATAVAVYKDKAVGIAKDGTFHLVRPEYLLVATGARERTLVFPGSDLPGVYGAGAFQTLVNRDLVQASERLFVIGGGNVGVIAAYHALQAGIDVVGLVEAMPRCGGYRVHETKIRRLGVPVWTSHTVLRAEGREQVERVVVSQIDKQFHPIPGTQRLFEVDTVLVAVGLSPVDELYRKAVEYGMTTFVAGDAEEIAEASAAIFSGKIVGRRMAREMGFDVDIPARWEPLTATLKSRPGPIHYHRPQRFGGRATYSLFSKPLFEQEVSTGRLASRKIAKAIGIDTGGDPDEWETFTAELGERLAARGAVVGADFGANVTPLIWCDQEIPCNPCSVACPLDSITMEGSIMALPEFEGKCQGCGKCVLACPGLAITLVYNNYDPEGERALLMLPFEFESSVIPTSRTLTTTDYEGNVIGEGWVVDLLEGPHQDRRKLLLLEVPEAHKRLVAGFRVRVPEEGTPLDASSIMLEEDPIVCHCERVRKSDIVRQIRAGIRDMNHLKASIRSGMGACGGRTCTEQILRIFREEGVPLDEVTRPTIRPFVAEIRLGDFLREDDG